MNEEALTKLTRILHTTPEFIGGNLTNCISPDHLDLWFCSHESDTVSRS